MMFRNHLVVTTAVAIVSVKYIEFAMPLWAVIGCIYFGSLFPDLDHPSSTIGRRMRFISIPLGGIFGHRQITHSIWPFVGVVLLFDMQGPGGILVFAFMIGYFSHLLGDILSDSGIPLLWPMQARVGVKMCSTGSVIEYIVAYGLLGLAFLL